MGQGFLPGTDAGLLAFAENASTLITAAPLDYGVTSSFATSYADALADYSAKYTLAKSDATRGKVATANKNTARQTMRQLSRQLNAFAQAHPGITDGQLTALGLKIRDRIPTPTPPVGLAPVVTVKSVNGRVVRGNLRDATTESSRRRPINARGAVVLIAYGPTAPPANSPGWMYMGQTGKTVFAVEFPEAVQPGEPCYISAMWVNERGERSPASVPITTYLQIGPAAAGEAAMKIAA